MKRITVILLLLSLCGVCLAQQPDRKEVRRGNREYGKGKYKESEIEYRKALVKDSASFAANYNLASSLYKQGNFEESGKSLERIGERVAGEPKAADFWFNKGNVDLQKKDYGAAVQDFKQSLLLNPDDMDAKESYAYAKKMQDRQNQQDQQNQQNQQNQLDRQNQQDQQNQQNQQDQKNRDRGGEGQQPQQIPRQQAEQLLQAIQAKEKDTQEKVNKEKAMAVKSRQKEKNW